MWTRDNLDVLRGAELREHRLRLRRPADPGRKSGARNAPPAGHERREQHPRGTRRRRAEPAGGGSGRRPPRERGFSRTPSEARGARGGARTQPRRTDAMIADCRPPAHRGRQRRRISGPFAHDSRTAALAGGRPCGAALESAPGRLGSCPDDSAAQGLAVRLAAGRWVLIEFWEEVFDQCIPMTATRPAASRSPKRLRRCWGAKSQDFARMCAEHGAVQANETPDPRSTPLGYILGPLGKVAGRLDRAHSGGRYPDRAAVGTSLPFDCMEAFRARVVTWAAVE